MGLTTNYADHPVLVGRFDSFAPARSADGLPVYVARVPAAPFCETPILNSAADPTTSAVGRIPPVAKIDTNDHELDQERRIAPRTGQSSFPRTRVIRVIRGS